MKVVEIYKFRHSHPNLHQLQLPHLYVSTLDYNELATEIGANQYYFAQGVTPSNSLNISGVLIQSISGIPRGAIIPNDEIEKYLFTSDYNKSFDDFINEGAT